MPAAGLEPALPDTLLYSLFYLINATLPDMLDAGGHSHYISHNNGEYLQAPAFSLLVLLLPLWRRAMAQEIH